MLVETHLGLRPNQAADLHSIVEKLLVGEPVCLRNVSSETETIPANALVHGWESKTPEFNEVFLIAREILDLKDLLPAPIWKNLGGTAGMLQIVLGNAQIAERRNK